jgi:hypothetical protein
MDRPRWEMGSSFPLITGDEAVHEHPFGAGRYFGSGRQALAALVRHGMQEHGWETLHVPTYYCPEVVRDLSRVTNVRRYWASPEGDVSEPAAGKRDAVLLMSYFGEPPASVGHEAGARIVDATHDPLAAWLDGLDADYVVASLRKTAPLPDGGVVWSPRGGPLPTAEPAGDRQLAGTGNMLSAMSLKSAYLAGKAIDKKAYLELFKLADQYICGTEPGEMSSFSRAVLPTFPLGQWRRRRLDNIDAATAALVDLSHVEVLSSTFGVVLRFRSNALQEMVRSALIDQSVFPAVLWDLSDDDVPEAHAELSRRMLFLHADFRWTRADMDKVTSMVLAVCAAFDREETRC